MQETIRKVSLKFSLRSTRLALSQDMPYCKDQHYNKEGGKKDPEVAATFYGMIIKNHISIFLYPVNENLSIMSRSNRKTMHYV